jgi:hypothetical protein
MIMRHDGMIKILIDSNTKDMIITIHAYFEKN